MQVHVLQQVFPNWDTLRIMRSRHDHLDWMHRHFAHKAVTGSDILAEVDADTAARTSVGRVGGAGSSRLTRQRRLLGLGADSGLGPLRVGDRRGLARELVEA